MAIPISNRLQELIERRMGMDDGMAREEAFEAMTKTCPPIDPHLIKHLEHIFSKTGVKANNPLLPQLLQVQHGINLILEYMQCRYDQQSLAARQARSV